jgi:hypothetical protein
MLIIARCARPFAERADLVHSFSETALLNLFCCCYVRCVFKGSEEQE